MESQFTQEVTTYCRLTFSNEYAKESKPIFYPKFIAQKPINFTKKIEKKSLKNSNANRFMNLNKNPQKQSVLSKKNSLKKNQSIRLPNSNVSNQKSSKKLEFKNESQKNLSISFPETKQKSYKSLERQPARKAKPQRNIIEELKNYKFKIKQTLKKAEPLYIPLIPKFIASQSSSDLNKSANYNQPKLYLQSQKKFPVSSPFLDKANLSPDKFLKMSPVKSPEKVTISPVKNSFQDNSLNLAFSSPLKLSRVPTLEKTLNISSSQPQITKTSSSNQNFSVNKNFTSNSEKFIKIFGDIEMEQGLKEDLIASMEFLPMGSQPDNETKVSICAKQSNSQMSTLINSELKVHNIKSQSDFSETLNITKKSCFGQISKTDYKLSSTQDFKYKQSFVSSPFKKVQNVSFSNLKENQIFQSKLPEQNKQEQFRQKCELQNNFRSIISVHSECESSSSSEDSIIINNHPKQAISNSPIKTLF